MSSEIVPVSADDINKEHELAQADARSALDHALECGRMLNETKINGKRDGTIPHGEWGLWIKEKVSFSADTANVYMKLDRNRDKLNNESDQILTIAEARRKLAPKKLTTSDDAPQEKTAKHVFEKLTNADQKILKADIKKAKGEIRAEAKAEAKDELSKYQEERRKVGETRTQLASARAMVQDPFTEAEFKLIRGMLHPDKHPQNQKRAQRAFDVFIRIEAVCKRKERKAA